MSRNVPDKVNVVVFTWKGNVYGARFHPSYVTKIDRFGGKVILMCGCIMLGSRTPLFVFDASTVNSQRYREEILEAYGRFFWVLWAPTTFLWTIMRSHTELILLKNFMKK
ncbi:hypothetical protein TNCV_2692941 [Trichonephila clavipes]|uniref:Uncharacterized protein n=1 Tax=Trichonephila clavipes TaxID=2585209 RepID=A0A8X6VYW9_TRICX|nr:hypothetical protein TNCV_2692941 [Trichonephila clavipes]